MFAVVLMLVSTFAIVQEPSAGLDDTLDVARLKSYSAARVFQRKPLCRQQ